jgi:hypothetical protein
MRFSAHRGIRASDVSATSLLVRRDAARALALEGASGAEARGIPPEKTSCTSMFD